MFWGQSIGGVNDLKRLFISILIIVLIASMLSGCKSDITEDMTLAVCGSYAVPGMFCHELKGDTFSCEIVERDSAGRILYLYTTQNIISDSVESVYVICQKYDSRYVYFYEDICYAVGDSDEENIEALKALNDWDKPLNDDKMAARSKSVNMDLYITTDTQLDHYELVRYIANELSVEQENISKLVFLDNNMKEKSLYYLQLDSDAAYLVISDENYDLCFNEIAYEDDIFDALPEFKLNCEW